MALITVDRDQVGTQYMRDKECPGSITKPQLSAAIATVDDWLDTNLTSLNSALPVAFRTNATTAQKYTLLMYVLLKRMARF